MSDAATRANALDHVVVVLFENRSLDNLLGHLYGPEDGKTFEGVIGKDLSNPIPEWAENGADRKVVPYTVATDIRGYLPSSSGAPQRPIERKKARTSAAYRSGALCAAKWPP
jgi:phospholipase C